jgi:uncharacterized protein YbaP (TraB family)
MFSRLVFTFLAACTAGLSTAALPPKDGDRLDHSLLWSITGNGLEDTSWLYGTIHVIGRDDFFVRPEVEYALEKAEELVLEIKLNDLSMLMQMNQLMMLPEGQTLRDLLEPEDYEAISAWVQESLGQSMQQYDRMKPFALLQLAVQSLLPRDIASYEMHFMTLFVEDSREVAGLETLADQFAAFEAIPPKEQVLYTLETIRNADSMQQVFADMVDAYTSEDIDRLFRMIVEESPEFREYSGVLLDDRNVRWIPKMEEMAAAHSCLFAVGAGHLPGPKGVIALLREQGYTVEAIPPKN